MTVKAIVACVAGAVGIVVVFPAVVFGVALVSTQQAAVAQVSVAACGFQYPFATGPGVDRPITGGGEWSPDQLANARTIVEVGRDRSLPRRAAVIAVSTALVESDLRNVAYGDRDSLGLFQQRPSQGWGTRDEVLNPSYAAGAFYDRLVTVPGWRTLPPGRAAQAVQRSAFPDRYAPQEAPAAQLVARFWRGTPTGADTQAAAPNPDGVCPDSTSDLPSDQWELPEDFALPGGAGASAAVSYAVNQLGKPYEWGATGPDAFDCSGLTQAAWAHAGVPISRTTTGQVHDGVAVGSLRQVRPGDLLFIPGSLGTADNPRHVGLYAGDGMVVNAYDEQHGVVLQPLDTWAGEIVAIRRITTDGSSPTPAPGERT
ncbi:C40 family peptidase [Saccharomonospora saliphila]|uniref:C40 family peptidase n=1 Tax=Saccharomonospora saliphila TaxID=369829 RepID=UPI000362352B|nr:C40 family peptidase [Saccharomonospora saliphila]